MKHFLFYEYEEKGIKKYKTATIHAMEICLDNSLGELKPKRKIVLNDSEMLKLKEIYGQSIKIRSEIEATHPEFELKYVPTIKSWEGWLKDKKGNPIYPKITSTRKTELVTGLLCYAVQLYNEKKEPQHGQSS